MLLPLERRVNQIFPKMPSPVGEHYVHHTPVWLNALVRLAFGVGAIVLTVWFYLDWSTTTLGFRALACVLVPAFAFSALHKETWGTADFIATDNGIFFPCNELRVIILGRERKNSWLWVPWANIDNVRLAKYDDHDNDRRTCVAFDLNVSQEERASFFRGVSNPIGSASIPKKILSVAYGGALPSPKKAFARLKELELRHGASSHGTRRDEAASRS
jgi:hypothetical protein